MACLRILRRDRALTLFPIITAIVVPLEVVAVFAIGTAAFGGRESGSLMALLDASNTDRWWQGSVLLLAMYFVTHLTVSLLHGAFAWCVLASLEGRPARMRDGFRAARRALARLFVWTLVTTVAQCIADVVGRTIGGRLGQLVFGVNLAAWSFATLLVVPVLVSEEGGAVAGIRRGMTLFTRTWGEQTLMRVGFAASFLILALSGAAVIFAGAVAIGLAAGAEHASAVGGGGLAGLALIVIWLVVLSIVFQCLRQIYVAALYGYAVTGMLPDEISPELMPARAGT